MKKTIATYISVPVLFVCLFCGCAEGTGDKGKTAKTAVIGIKELRVAVEVADSLEQRSKGLSGRKRLGKNSGMLFIFPQEGNHAFWMKGCYLDLDLAFLDSAGSVLKVLTMKKQAPNVPDYVLRAYEPGTPRVKYALEMNEGWFGKNGIKAGEKLVLPELAVPAD